MCDQLPCKSDIDIHSNCSTCCLHSCLMGGQIRYTSNGSEYISSAHSPVQIISNVPKQWPLDSTLPYQLVKQHSLKLKSACPIRCIRSNKYDPSLIYKLEIRGAVYMYNYTATGVMNGSHSGLTHKSLHLEVLLVSWVLFRLLT